VQTRWGQGPLTDVNARRAAFGFLIPMSDRSESGAVRTGEAVDHVACAVGGEPFSLTPVFTGWRKAVNLAGIVLWLAAMAWFWVWWLQPAHFVTPVRYALATLSVLWVTSIPAYFIFIFAGARIPRRGPVALPLGRVAAVVTKAPSEPFEIVRRTLEAAMAQDLGEPGRAHDTWLADEDPDPETLAWCRDHGVMVSTRKGVEGYHRDDWPRRKRCKEGNLAYFYDRYGYDRYDFVAQFDCDHVPEPDYLAHMLAPFADPAVGYVSAPSICDANAAESWSARGRLYVEASMHGALQTGYNNGWAPLCIGSHYTVRTAALKAVGGLGPELAEDHSTTLILNAGGWRGVHAIDAIAHGRGPDTFTDLIVQEFQWSRSLVTLLLRYSPTYVPKLPGRLRFQFLFSELWYPAYASVMALGFITPMIALLTKSRFLDMTFADYVVHAFPLSALMLVLAYWWRSTGLFRPADAKILSWEGMAFLFLRWPWSLIGSLTAVWDRLTGAHVDFRITPKGEGGASSIPFRVLAPYIALGLGSAACVWLVREPGTAAGFYVFNLITAVCSGAAVLLILALHARENRRPVFTLDRAGAASALSMAAIAALTVLGARENGARGLAAMNTGVTAFTLTETVYSPSGAGQPYAITYRIRPRWHGFGEQAAPPSVQRARGGEVP